MIFAQFSFADCDATHGPNSSRWIKIIVQIEAMTFEKAICLSGGGYYVFSFG